MAAKNPERQRLVGAIAGTVSKVGPDDPRLPGLRRDLKAVELEEFIRKVVAAAPPLTDEQRTRLAALLRPSAPDSAA